MLILLLNSQVSKNFIECVSLSFKKVVGYFVKQKVYAVSSIFVATI